MVPWLPHVRHCRSPTWRHPFTCCLPVHCAARCLCGIPAIRLNPANVLLAKQAKFPDTKFPLHYCQDHESKRQDFAQCTEVRGLMSAAQHRRSLANCVTEVAVRVLLRITTGPRNGPPPHPHPRPLAAAAAVRPALPRLGILVHARLCPSS